MPVLVDFFPLIREMSGEKHKRRTFWNRRCRPIPLPPDYKPYERLVAGPTADSVFPNTMA